MPSQQPSPHGSAAIAVDLYQHHAACQQAHSQPVTGQAAMSQPVMSQHAASQPAMSPHADSVMQLPPALPAAAAAMPCDLHHAATAMHALPAALAVARSVDWRCTGQPDCLHCMQAREVIPDSDDDEGRPAAGHNNRDPKLAAGRVHADTMTPCCSPLQPHAVPQAGLWCLASLHEAQPASQPAGDETCASACADQHAQLATAQQAGLWSCTQMHEAEQPPASMLDAAKLASCGLEQHAGAVPRPPEGQEMTVRPENDHQMHQAAAYHDGLPATADIVGNDTSGFLTPDSLALQDKANGIAAEREAAGAGPLMPIRVDFDMAAPDLQVICTPFCSSRECAVLCSEQSSCNQLQLQWYAVCCKLAWCVSHMLCQTCHVGRRTLCM